jgi:succinate dehydrogenase/fumarate reductase-like Fe-S protein
MSLTRRTAAWINLAWRFGTHVLVRMPGRVIRRSADMQRFLEAVVPEGYTPLTPEDRDLLPAAMRCVGCGLCSLGCTDLHERSASAWEESWTFVVGPSRSIDRAQLVAAGLNACSSSADAAAVCPMGVPIAELDGLVRRMHAPSTAALPEPDSP